MKKRILAVAMAFIAIIVFAATVNAQRVAVAVVDQHYASETSHYKIIMGALIFAYVVYMVLHNKRKKEMNRLMGRY